MLVLSRKVGEKVVLNNNIVVTVVEIQGHKVRIGIEAPQHVPVHREEVWLQIMGKTEDLSKLGHD